MLKIYLYLCLSFIFTLNISAHDAINCDVLKNYDFSGFEDWKSEVVQRSDEFGLDRDFVSELIAP